MRIKLKEKEIRHILEIDSEEFPKYTTQIINLANQNAQGTRPPIVGQLSDLIQEFKGHSLAEWHDWYLKRYPHAIREATQKIHGMVVKLRESMHQIDEKLIEKWVKDLVIVKTFLGLRFQEAILRVVAKETGKAYRLAAPAEEAKGIDGFVGDTPISIKPVTYKTKSALQEKIQATIIYYEKEQDGITIEFENLP
ncbi:MAG TPA: MjaI family restriction endonuclease [Bacteroidota bacterium]|nr:MjaI family restriction endonuclease [Bacteroidota bacterium]